MPPTFPTRLGGGRGAKWRCGHHLFGICCGVAPRLFGRGSGGSTSHPQAAPPSRHHRHLYVHYLGPAVLLFVLLVYLLFGAAAFLFLEQSEHEEAVRRFYFKLAVSRRQEARRIASAIFNGDSAGHSGSSQAATATTVTRTPSLMVIIDRPSVERVHNLLATSLRDYEQQLAVAWPNRHAWTLGNSFTYAWALLTTIGHGNRAPATWGGQMFALCYCLLGVPYFVLCLIAVSYRLFDACRSSRCALAQNHLFLLLASVVVYAVWLVVFALLLYTFHSAPPQLPPSPNEGSSSATSDTSTGWSSTGGDSFSRALYTAVLSSLTIQTPDYIDYDDESKLLTLAGSTLSLLFSCAMIFFLTGYYQRVAVTCKKEGAEEGESKETIEVPATVATLENGGHPRVNGQNRRGNGDIDNANSTSNNNNNKLRALEEKVDVAAI